MNAFRNALALSTMLIPGHALAESAAGPGPTAATALEDLGSRLEHWLAFANSEYQTRIVRRLSVPGKDESVAESPAAPPPPVAVTPKPVDEAPRAAAEEKRAETPAVASAERHEDVSVQPPAASLPLGNAGRQGGPPASKEERAEPAPVLAAAPALPLESRPPSPAAEPTPPAEVHPPVPAGSKEPGEPAVAPPPATDGAAAVPEPSASPPASAKEGVEPVPPNLVKEAEDSARDAIDTAKRRLEDEKRASGASRQASRTPAITESKPARHVRHGTARRHKPRAVLADAVPTEKTVKGGKRSAKDRADETPKRRVRHDGSDETEVAAKSARGSDARAAVATVKSEPARLGPKTRIKIATAAENKPLRAVLESKPRQSDVRRAGAKKPVGGTQGKAEVSHRDVADRKRTHVVRAGDSLWRIAKRHWGDGARYQRIVRANRSKLDDPDLIYPGQKLVIPKA